MAWRSEYLGALHVRDALEHANKEIYDAYTKLADRSVEVQLDSAAVNSTKASNTAQMQIDLIEAQKARGELTKQISDMTYEAQKLLVKSRDEGKRIVLLSAERNSLAIKLKDRDEELRTKRKLLDNLHDETVALTLQLNVEIEKSQKLKDENQELIDRWMARMGQEADAMNTKSKFS